MDQFHSNSRQVEVNLRNELINLILDAEIIEKKSGADSRRCTEKPENGQPSFGEEREREIGMVDRKINDRGRRNDGESRIFSLRQKRDDRRRVWREERE